jgi:hypothetical protein
LQLGLHAGCKRVIDRATNGGYQGNGREREDYRDIAAPILMETANQSKEIVHG